MSFSSLVTKIHEINFTKLYLGALAVVGNLATTYSQYVPEKDKIYVQAAWSILLVFQVSPVQLTPLEMIKRGLAAATAAETIIPQKDAAKLHSYVNAISAVEPLVPVALGEGVALGKTVVAGEQLGGSAFNGAVTLASPVPSVAPINPPTV